VSASFFVAVVNCSGKLAVKQRHGLPQLEPTFAAYSTDGLFGLIAVARLVFLELGCSSMQRSWGWSGKAGF
jgi:hypothetical protein